MGSAAAVSTRLGPAYDFSRAERRGTGGPAPRRNARRRSSWVGGGERSPFPQLSPVRGQAADLRFLRQGGRQYHGRPGGSRRIRRGPLDGDAPQVRLKRRDFLSSIKNAALRSFVE